LNILVANDDGIHRRGIQELVAALSQIEGANIYVFAPDRERTAAGHGITMRDSLYIEPWNMEDYPGALEAYSCSGTPADCVKVGMAILRQRGIDIDLVCGGINHGSNLGTDVYYSGTIACAMEGRLLGVPAIAFSLCSHDCSHFEIFKDLVPQIVTKSLGKIPSDTILNVNVPDLPPEQLAGVLVTGMGPKDYNDLYYPVQETKKGIYYEYKSTDVYYPDADLSWDVGGYQSNYVTTVPITVSMTRRDNLELIKAWGIEL
jgi:5'-nucleotidase